MVAEGNREVTGAFLASMGLLMLFPSDLLTFGSVTSSDPKRPTFSGSLMAVTIFSSLLYNSGIKRELGCSCCSQDALENLLLKYKYI